MRTAPWKLAIVILGSMIYWPATIVLMLFAALGNARSQPALRTVVVGVAMSLLYAYVVRRILGRRGAPPRPEHLRGGRALEP